MRFLAIILLACIVFLSSFGGMVKAAQPQKQDDCCKMMGKMACQHKSANGKTNGCNEPGCPMMFSCDLCGFIVKEHISIKPVFAAQLAKPVLSYKIGDVAHFNKDSWKPPRSC